MAAPLNAPTDSARRPWCAECDRPIVELPYGGWGDADAPALVYCYNQDETHDGIRHEPEEEPRECRDCGRDLDGPEELCVSCSAEELARDRRIEDQERRDAGEL